MVRRYLTQEEFDYIQPLLAENGVNNDRITAYIFVRDITGSDAVTDMTQIASGTGFVGGAAWAANEHVYNELGITVELR